MEKEISIHHQNRAKAIVDMLFDTKIFKEQITRNDMQAVEDYVAFEFSCYQNSAKKSLEFQKKIEKFKNDGVLN